MYASVPSQYLDLLWLLLLKISSVSVLERVNMLVVSSVKMFSFRFLVCFLLLSLLLLLLRRTVRMAAYCCCPVSKTSSSRNKCGLVVRSQTCALFARLLGTLESENGFVPVWLRDSSTEIYSRCQERGPMGANNERVLVPCWQNGSWVRQITDPLPVPWH